MTLVPLLPCCVHATVFVLCRRGHARLGRGVSAFPLLLFILYGGLLRSRSLQGASHSASAVAVAAESSQRNARAHEGTILAIPNPPSPGRGYKGLDFIVR